MTKSPAYLSSISVQKIQKQLIMKIKKIRLEEKFTSSSFSEPIRPPSRNYTPSKPNWPKQTQKKQQLFWNLQTFRAIKNHRQGYKLVFYPQFCVKPASSAPNSVDFLLRLGNPTEKPAGHFLSGDSRSISKQYRFINLTDNQDKHCDFNKKTPATREPSSPKTRSRKSTHTRVRVSTFEKD